MQGFLNITGLIFLFIAIIPFCNAQTVLNNKSDSLLKKKIRVTADTTVKQLKKLPDTLFKSVKKNGQSIAKSLKNVKSNNSDSLIKKKIRATADTSFKQLKKIPDTLLNSIKSKGQHFGESLKNLKANNSDSLLKKKIRSTTDTTIKQLKKLPDTLFNSLKSKGQHISESLKNLKVNNLDSFIKMQLPSFSLRNQFNTKPLIKFTGGYNTYNFNYRSYIDTPLAEINIYQHYANGSLGYSVGVLPLKVNYLFSRSNSVLFREINDIQVAFDVNQYKTNLYSGLKNNLLSIADKLRDSVLEMNYKIKLKRVSELSDLLNTPMKLQMLTEYREIINIPDLSKDVNLSDSINKHRIDSAQATAISFITSYDLEKRQFDSIKATVDSLRKVYEKMISRFNTVRNLLSKKLSGEFDVTELENKLKEQGVYEKIIPAKYKRLLNIRRLGAGRNLLNYSELTSKNISLKGVNFEYSSKAFYAAVAAGAVDYRYRDFVVNTGLKSRQYMYMLRIGKGRVEGNHFFITYYKGQKQASFSNSNNQKLLSISGISAEMKYRIARNINLVAEVAESMSADLKTTPVSYSKFSFDENKNKAVSFKLNSYFPKTRTRVDALYKYTGANFQSFSSFQTNSALKAWHVKIDQSLLKRKLKITGAIRTNDFSNPYILQQYSSNTVFKSLQATYHAKHFPTISIGYSPVSQLTKLDNQVIDNQFNSLNALVTKSYRIGIAPSSSSLMYNRFYNNMTDTGFAYYNAANIFFSQMVAFTYYTMNMAVSQSKSRDYELNVLDVGLQAKLGKLGRAGFGVKVNNFNKKETKTSVYGSLQLNLRRWGVLNMVYDDGFIPGSNKTFIKNDMFNLVFTQSF